MDEYIKRDDALKILFDGEDFLLNDSLAYQRISRLPSVHVSLVRYGRWIPEAEQVPMPEEMVLVIVSGKPHQNITLDDAYELASFSMDEGWILEQWPEWEGPEVKYWTPLPDPPKEVVGDE